MMLKTGMRYLISIFWWTSTFKKNPEREIPESYALGQGKLICIQQQKRNSPAIQGFPRIRTPWLSNFLLRHNGGCPFLVHQDVVFGIWDLFVTDKGSVLVSAIPRMNPRCHYCQLTCCIVGANVFAVDHTRSQNFIIHVFKNAYSIMDIRHACWLNHILGPNIYSQNTLCFQNAHPASVHGFWNSHPCEGFCFVMHIWHASLLLLFNFSASSLIPQCPH